MRLALALALAATLTVAVLSAVAAPPPLAAAPAPQMLLDPRVALADSVYFAGDATGALELLDAVANADSPADPTSRYEALWRAARASVALGVVAEGDGPWQSWYERAQGYAARAVEVDPSRLEGPYWDVAAKGRIGLRAGPFEASNLAEAVRSGSHRILAVDPDHAGAHNALGRLYLQVLNLNWATRQLARVLSGRAAVSEATWETAEYHLRRAVELDPTMLLYRVDLLRLLTDRRRWVESAELYEAAAALPLLHPADAVFRREAARLRDRIP